MNSIRYIFNYIFKNIFIFIYCRGPLVRYLFKRWRLFLLSWFCLWPCFFLAILSRIKFKIHHKPFRHLNQKTLTRPLFDSEGIRYFPDQVTPPTFYWIIYPLPIFITDHAAAILFFSWQCSNCSGRCPIQSSATRCTPLFFIIPGSTAILKVKRATF